VSTSGTTGIALLGALLLPLLVACGLGLGGLRERALALAPWSALPALLIALFPPALPAAEFPDLLLGVRLELDATGRVFLLLASLLWLIAGLHARSYLASDPWRARFFGFFLVTMTGNLGVALAQDAASFYLFFSLMTFAAYGLVVHEAHPEAQRAARVYMVLAVLGEALLLPGIVLAATAAGTLELREIPAAVAAAPNRDLIVFLLLGGFSIKLGALPLHIWLPLAHPAAPTPASAVLSGTMIKAGLLGWLRFLPLGEAELPGWGTAVLILGLTGAFFGALVGVFQVRPKTVLAYSSVSQMGLVIAGIGIGLLVPAAWPLVQPAVVLYALHHGLVKGALFLSVSITPALGGRGRVPLLLTAGLLLPALALAGAPFTSGSVGKTLLKDAAQLAPGGWPKLLELLLPLAAVGTVLLMLRFLLLVRPAPGAPPKAVPAGQWVPWAVSVAAVLVLAVAWQWGPHAIKAPDRLPDLWPGLWPIGVGVLIAWAWARLMRSSGAAMPHIPEGDVLALLPRITGSNFIRGLRWTLATLPRGFRTALQRRLRPSDLIAQQQGVVALWELRLMRWTTAGTLLLVLTALFFLVLAVL
jgi:formate hydrogenlyase subunit 3/multisubunit Na+/H+ antiporter MnhD subunit